METVSDYDLQAVYCIRSVRRNLVQIRQVRTQGTRVGNVIRFLLLMLLLQPSGMLVAEEVQYPAYFRTTANLNIRSGPGMQYKILDQLRKGDTVIIQYTEEMGKGIWGMLYYNQEQGYVSMRYVEYLSQYEPPVFEKESWWKELWSKVWKVVKVLLIILAGLLVLAYWEDILQIVITAGFFSGGGALLFSILFDNGQLGAIIGLCIAALMGLVIILDHFDIGISDLDFSIIFKLAYYVISFPMYMLNRLEHALVEPWRYIFKTSWVGEGVKPVLRVVLEVLGVLLVIALTPLRLFNAIVYNILIHCMTGMYDLFVEVLIPCDEKEGAENVWKWIVFLPWRILKYLVFHGMLTVIESVLWTVIDIFVPASTMYHGTDLVAGEAITRDPMRNRHTKDTARWSHGTFTASQSNWGGIGVYFASRRLVAKEYATDPHRLSDDNPVIIVCRVSLGRIINYALAPKNVYNQAGQYGNHSVLNDYGAKHGYTTGEWWNDSGCYWEYCMFDWQNRYNHPWRIRPVYLYNVRTGRVQHIRGGMQHWLFDKAVLKDLKDEITRW